MIERISIRWSCMLVACLGLAGALSISSAAPLPAFPGAEGYGALASGGRGGAVYHVTTLADSGTGSFRDAVSQPNRTVVFGVGGVINLSSDVEVKDNITIAGQTAPGQGISTYGATVYLNHGFGTTSSYGHSNIIIRCLRFRQGYDPSGSGYSLALKPAHSVMLDHCSIEVGNWQTLSITYNESTGEQPTDITVQNCIVGASVWHQLGALSWSPVNLTWHHYLFIDNAGRDPKAWGNMQIINDVVCNFRLGIYGDGGETVDFIGNYQINGPGSNANSVNTGVNVNGTNAGTYYLSGNYWDNNLNGKLDGVHLAAGTGSFAPKVSPTQICSPTIPVTVDSAALAFHKVVCQAGCSLSRDPLDAELISQAQSLGTRGPGAGLYMGNTDPTNSWTGDPIPAWTITGGSAPVDSDGDGMPDEWEVALGSDYATPDNNVVDANGYTKLENYLNWLATPNLKTYRNIAATNYDLWSRSVTFTNQTPVYALSNPTNGAVTLISNRWARFVPATNFTVLGSFTFTITATNGPTMTNLVGVLITPPSLPTNGVIPAFPGAEGFGAYATGGRYGDVYHVVNLSSSATTPGSLAYGLANAPTNGRTIVFDVSGYIPVSGNLYLDRSKITIAGQTAPGDGVGIKGGTFWIRASDAVIRHFRLRNGVSADCVDITSEATNTVIDHCDMLFSKDENFSSFGTPPENLTFQWSANAWGLYSHSAGGLWDMNHVTAHHTLWAHNHTRDPKAHPNGLLDWINNVTYDYGIGFIMGDSTSTADWKANVEGCYFVCPPSNIRGYVLSRASLDGNGNPNFSLFYTNCLFDRDGDTILDGRAVVSGDITGNYRLMTSPFPRTAGVPVTQDSPLVAYKKIVSLAGPLRLDANHADGLRDEVSTELIRSMTTWRRDAFSHVADTGASSGGYGTLNSTPPPADTDRDGMPDFWEAALGSNPAGDDHTNQVPAGAFVPSVPAGYTLLEEYLHFKATPHAVVPRSYADNLTSLEVDLRRYTSGFTNKPPVTYTVSGATNSTVTLVGGTVAHFEPATNFFGRARFEFTVTDGDGSSWTQTFFVLVSAVALPRDLRWKGDGVTNAWSTNAANFLVVTNATAFRDGDNVTFDEAGSRISFVRLSGMLSPASVTVAAANNFTFGGTGALAGAMTLAKSGAGTLTLSNTNTYSGGTVISEGEVILAPGGNIGSGSNTLAGGTITSLYSAATDFVLGGDVVVPTGETGTVNLSRRMALTGASGGGTLNLNISGTAFIYDRLHNNYANFTGTLNIVGTVANALLTLNYNGGDFDGNWSNAVVSLDNVTLQGRHNSGGNTLQIGALSGTATARLGGSGYAGNQTLDLGGLNLDTTFAGSIEDGVATTFLNKNGTGLLILSGTSSFTGATTVNAGELRVTGSMSGSEVTIAGNATLSGTGTLGGGVTLRNGAMLSPGLGFGHAGALMVSNGLTLPAPTLRFDLSSSPAGANDRITMLGGTLAMSGVQNYVFNLTDGFLGAGTYSLIEGATGSTAWSGVTHNLPSGTRQAFAMQRPAAGSNPSYVRLVVTGNAASLVWRGTNGSAWDSATTNWLNGAAADKFMPFDAVRFDDSATNCNVAISGAVAPRGVIVSNTTRAYTLGGGSLDGATSLLKQGNGTLTLSGSNNFSGGVFLNGGTLALANDTANASAPGTGSITFNGGTLAMFDDANSYNSFLADLVVPTGASGTFNADARCDIYSALSGGGTLNFRAQWVRTTIFGDWSDFTGRLNILRGPNGGDFRIGAAYWWLGLPRAAVNLGANTSLYYAGTLSEGAGTEVEFGELSGASSARLLGGATGGRSLTYRVGGLNTDATFAGAIAEQNTGTTTHFEKLGTGTWTLSGNNSFLGDILVSAGTLLVNSPAGSATGLGGVTVASGARLAGSGSIAGEVTLAPGATLDPIGTLTLSNALTLDDACTHTFALGTNSDRVTVAGDLVLGGTFHFTDAGGFGPGSYTLITWGGEFAAGNFAIGSVPNTNFNYAFDTNTPGQLRLVVSGGPTNILAPVTVITAGAFWKYFAQTNNLGTAWRSNNFSDTAWPSGPAMLGFGDANGLLPATVIASNRQWTTFFRRSFFVPDTNMVQSLDGRILRDDGAVVYLNGTEIWRDTNMPADVITNTTPALSAIGGTNETNWLALNLQPSILNLLRPGTNLLAIEVHQNALTSSDLCMNFELTATAFVSTNAALTVARDDAGLVFTWPATDGYYTLHRATNLVPPGFWMPVAAEPVLSNKVWTLTLQFNTNVHQFFRLQTP